MSIKFLKVKIKSLAEESKIIRLEEKRSSGVVREGLHLHRVNEVRDESRCAHLAYNYIKGKRASAYLRKEKDTKRVLTLIKKYGERQVTPESLVDWIVESHSSAGSLGNAPAFNLAS